VAGALLGSGIFFGAGTPAALAQGEMEHFGAYLDGVMAAQFRNFKLAGMTFALVQDGELVLSRGYGEASLETAEPVDPAKTLFRPGSVSKLFTWTAVMQLVEQGKIDLNAPVSTYVHQFELPNAFGQPLTMTHIMTHAPGLEDGAAGFLFADEEEDLVPLADSLAAHIPEQIWEPGTYSAYSNWSTALAGLVVANISGMSFESYVDEHIFKPLGMAQATFDEPLPARLADDMAQGYQSKHNGIEPAGFEFIKNFGPAGALSASAEDMARFIVAHVQDGAFGEERILQADTARLMHARLFAHDPRVAGMAHGFYEIRRNGERFVGHGGDTIAFHSQLVIQPETDFGFFLSFNTPDGARARAAVVDAVIDYFYPGDGGAEPAVPAEPPAGSAERIAEIAGAYRVNRRSFTKLEAMIGLAGDLNVVPGPEGEIVIPGEQVGGRFREVSPWVFRAQGRQATIVFDADDDGRVSRAFFGSLPIMVADKMAFWQTAANHQMVIGLSLLAAVFVLINAIRNRGGATPVGSARIGQVGLILASLSFLGFVVGLGVVFGAVDMQKVIFDFPPPGLASFFCCPSSAPCPPSSAPVCSLACGARPTAISGSGFAIPMSR
jgi:CubicO group peptidase (beta-lactamase class C family)